MLPQLFYLCSMTEFEEPAEESIEMVKVVFRFFSDLFDKEMIETMWCMPLDAELGLYQLDNIPFYAPLMAADDVIFAEKDDSEGGMLAFKKVVESSGNSTIHIVRMEESNSIESILKPVFDLGCNFEGINENYLALDVPSDIQYKEIRKILDTLEGNDIIGFVESCLSEIHQKQID